MDLTQPQKKLACPDESRRNREHGSVTVALIGATMGCPRALYCSFSPLTGAPDAGRVIVNHWLWMT
jgi:hypothetical protein